jgi:EAL domain-containing protein (putative c-di-GMP-specific phosphodiesterase class I)
MDRQSEEREIVRTIVAVASALGMAAVAEGVERIEQKQELQRLHCASAQGYLFWPPMEADAVRNLLRTSASAPS